MTLKTFRFRCTKGGHRLPLLLAILDKIKEDKITREEAAGALAVTVREVNQLMKPWNTSRPLKEYALNKAKAEVKWEIRKRFAIDLLQEVQTLGMRLREQRYPLVRCAAGLVT